ncbi:fibroblast growth factor receptor 1-like [Porites lutea]|uniref:fibroblast growth factor receptor 1-like n=1 Tax=Porites lutea TaxID=51062 RepID=UPI003CC56753
MTPCCPDIYPPLATLKPGENTSFACHVKLESGNKVSLEKYLDFTWYRKNGSSYVKISDSETRRYNESCSLLMIKNAKVTPVGGVYYHCEIFYRGNKLKNSKTYDVGLVVQDFSATRIEYCKVDGGSSVVREPNGVNLRCKAGGYPLATIRWFHNGTEIPVCKMETSSTGCAGGRYQVDEDRNRKCAYVESYLMIKDTKYPRDHGNYTCVANNSELQNATKHVEISVYSPPTLDKIREIWYSTTEIDCKVSRTNPLPTFRWQYQSGLCLNDNRECKPSDSKWQDVSAPFFVSPAVDVATGVSKLTLPQTLRSAFFRCVATNAMDFDDYVMRFLGGSYDKPLNIIARSTEHDEGNTMTLRCEMFWKGSNITWRKDGEQLSHAADRRVNISSTVRAHLTQTYLVVKRVATNNSGEYTCEAEDDSGHLFTYSINITIKKVFPPTILSFSNQTVYKNTTVKLRCNISAYPAPTVQWFKDGTSPEMTPVTMEESDSCESRKLRPGFYQVHNYVGQLLICSPSHADQTGFYTCQATNREGTSNATAFLDVLEDPNVFIIPSKDVFQVKLGALWNVTCKATGNPMPFVHWRKEKTQEVVTPKRRAPEVVMLTISPVTEADLGDYTCVAENSQDVTTAHVKLGLTELSNLPDVSATRGLSKEATVALSAVGAIVLLCIVLAFTFCCFFRRQQKQIAENRSQFFKVHSEEYQFDPDRTLLEQCNDLPYDPDFEFPEDKLILGEVLGSGAFGKVIKAEAIGMDDFSPRDKSPVKGGPRLSLLRRYINCSQMYYDSRVSASEKTTVAVKTLKEGATIEEYRDLASELKILMHVGVHTNIVNLLGACIKRDGILVILEYAPHGSLLKFLRGKRDVYEATWSTTTSDPEIRLDISNLVRYAFQISRGMEYLASKKCIHRDLAARNVLVGEDYVMKIADFGLARDIYKSDLYVKTTSGVLPIKWMALESLFQKEYSEKSDVWSFGILLWEIFTLGGAPYPTVPMECLLDFLSDGKRMENPQNCPSEIYNIMQNCWLEDRDKRPEFAQISILIGKILEQRASQRVVSGYIKLTEDNNYGRNDYYLDPLDADSTIPRTRADVYDRRSSQNIALSPLHPIPLDMENEPEPESDERQQMLEPEDNDTLSGNESGIELEEAGVEQDEAVELRPTGKARDSRYRNTLV